MNVARPLLLVALAWGAHANMARAVDPACDQDVRDVPSREDVFQALVSASPAVRACGRQRGEVAVRVEFMCDGSVSEVTFGDGIVLTTEEEACVTQALSTRRVPPFRRPRFPVTFWFPVGR